MSPWIILGWIRILYNFDIKIPWKLHKRGHFRVCKIYLSVENLRFSQFKKKKNQVYYILISILSSIKINK